MKTAIIAFVAALAGPAAAQDDLRAAMQTYLDANIRGWASDPVLIEAVRRQNQRTSGLSQGDIDTLDRTWRDEIGQSRRPTISPVIENAAAEFLREMIVASDGAVVEVFVMDARGLNVAASGITSDYWQGDEEKHSATFGAGSGALHFGDIEFDESSQSYQGQISMTLSDPVTDMPIGAITVGVNPEMLF